jgi:hypothetical protein
VPNTGGGAVVLAGECCAGSSVLMTVPDAQPVAATMTIALTALTFPRQAFTTQDPSQPLRARER